MHPPAPRLIRVLAVLVILLTPGLALIGPSSASARASAAMAQATPGDDGGTALIVHAYFTDRASLVYLTTHFDAMEAVNHAEGYVDLLMSLAEYESLKALGYRLEIDAARTALLNQPQVALPAQVSGIPGYPCYRTVEETYAAMAQIAADRPNLATWIDIGDSWEKLTPGGLPGYDLRVLILTNKAIAGPKPIFFLMAAIHAREYATAEMAARYAEYLGASYGVDPDVTWLLDHFEVHILPQANPDGRKLAEGGLYHRKNTNPTNGAACPDPYLIYHYGIDLNRNSSFQWGGVGSSPYPCTQTFRGPAQASEPETQAIETYVASIFPDQRGPALTDPAPDDASGTFITLHSYGREVLFPWGATTQLAPNAAGLQTLGQKFGYFNGYLVCQSGAVGCLYQTSGTTDDWAYGQLGVAAYTFEVGDDFFEPCASFEASVWPGNRPALLYALKAARRPYQAPGGPDTLALTASAPFVVAGTPLTLSAVADDTRYDSSGGGLVSSQPISAARYSLDAPVWVTGTVALSLGAADGTFNSSIEGVTATIDTSGWPAGRHLLFVESQDSQGAWGVPSALFVQSYAPGTVLQFFPLFAY
jgi:hypothetical protein